MTYYITPKYIENTFNNADVLNHFKGVVDTSMQSVDMSMVNDIITAMGDGQLAARRAIKAIADADKLNNDYGAAIRRMESINHAMELIHKNTHLCAMLLEISKLEMGNLKLSKNIYHGGLYPLPSKIPDMDLWLSAISTNNKIHIGVDNKARCVGLVDFEEKRTFEAIARESAPLYRKSRDKGTTSLGIENLQVVDITPTSSVFRLTEGEPIVLGDEYTIFRVIRTGVSNTNFKMFGDTAGVNSIYFNTPTNECLTITNGGVRVIETPQQSTYNDKVSVACLVMGKNFKWSANGISDLVPLNGDGLRTIKQPTSPIVLDTLFGGNSTGEFAEVLIYKRALSTVEISTLASYFSMVYSDNQAMQLVLTTLEQQ